MEEGTELQLSESVSPEEAVHELHARRKARHHLIDFIRYTMPGWIESEHHRHICNKIEHAVKNNDRRLILCVPPRHGKSEIASRRLPAWYLGMHPAARIIFATYNAEFATDFGREVRTIFSSDEYQRVFPNSLLAKDSRAANRWHTNNRGIYLAAGIGSGITGRGGDLVIIDDPIKDDEEADSILVRERLWNWYRSTLYTRLQPNATIIVIQTRWHDDDLVGRLLQAQDDKDEPDADTWEVVEFPAVCDNPAGDILGRQEGEALWPAQFSEDRLRTIRANLTANKGPRFWSALYQQKPIEDQGAYFKKEWIDDNLYDLAAIRPQIASGAFPMRIYAASDYAVTEAGGDYTVHLVVGVDEDATIYVLDLWRQQADSSTWVEAALDLMERWRPFDWGEESGQILRSLGPYIEKRMDERGIYCNRTQYPSTADKSTRAQAIRARMSMGKVKFPRRAEFLDTLTYELTRYPTGVYDDQVDALSLIGRMLVSMSSARKKKSEFIVDTPQVSTWGDVWKRQRSKNRRSRRVGEAPVIGQMPS